MTRAGKFIGIFITVTLLIAAVVWAVLVARYERAFEATTDGETTSLVVNRFGEPTAREIPEVPYLRYASRACQNPCAVRLWWEHPVLGGLEAWSVEFDNSGKVVHKAHWVSP